jgi:hypothetical protein
LQSRCATKTAGARQHDFAASIFANRNDFPRELMLEALLRYIE